MDKRQKEQAAAKEAELEMNGRTNESFTPVPAAGSGLSSTDNHQPKPESASRLKSASTVVTVSDIKPDSLAEDESQWVTRIIPKNHQSPSNKNSVFKKVSKHDIRTVHSNLLSQPKIVPVSVQKSGNKSD